MNDATDETLRTGFATRTCGLTPLRPAGGFLADQSRFTTGLELALVEVPHERLDCLRDSATCRIPGDSHHESRFWSRQLP